MGPGVLLSWHTATILPENHHPFKHTSVEGAVKLDSIDGSSAAGWGHQQPYLQYAWQTTLCSAVHRNHNSQLSVPLQTWTLLYISLHIHCPTWPRISFGKNGGTGLVFQLLSLSSIIHCFLEDEPLINHERFKGLWAWHRLRTFLTKVLSGSICSFGNRYHVSQKGHRFDLARCWSWNYQLTNCNLPSWTIINQMDLQNQTTPQLFFYYCWWSSW